MYPGVVQYWVKIVFANKLCQLYTILCVLCLLQCFEACYFSTLFFGPMFQALTCMFLELLKQLFPIFVLRDVANKKTMVIVGYGNTNSFAFLQLGIIQLKMHNIFQGGREIISRHSACRETLVVKGTYFHTWHILCKFCELCNPFPPSNDFANLEKYSTINTKRRNEKD